VDIKILVVDDEPMIVETLEMKFKEKGYTVYTATDGKAAIKEAKDKLPDLILLDVMMPKMNGFEVLKKLKADRKTVNIPIVMLTGEKEQKDIAEGIRNQAEKYLVKPLDSDQVLIEIEKTLSLRMRRI